MAVRADTSALMPGAPKPSSLVTTMDSGPLAEPSAAVVVVEAVVVVSRTPDCGMLGGSSLPPQPTATTAVTRVAATICMLRRESTR
jgi:hypothetical protein